MHRLGEYKLEMFVLSERRHYLEGYPCFGCQNSTKNQAPVIVFEKKSSTREKAYRFKTTNSTFRFDQEYPHDRLVSERKSNVNMYN